MKVNIAKWPKRAAAAILAVLLAITFLPFSNFNLVTSKAAAGDVPAHDKVLTVNADGTYTLALNVTGDSEKKPQKVNVLVIVDRSGSMDTQSGTGAYVPTNGTGTGLYGLIEGNYVPLERRGTPGNRTFWYNGVQYTGQRYQYDGTATRMQATQSAVNSLAETLLDYNGKDGNPADTVQMALVSFATTAQTNVNPTTSFSTYSTAVNGLDADGGTNWESALQAANGISFGDNDQTFVIFFSDGSPTFHSTDGGYGNWNNTYRVYGSGQEQEPNMERSYTQAVDDAATLAQKFGVKNFYTIFAYGTNVGAGYMRNLTTAAGAPAENNYSAGSTAELNDAFAEILESIELSGIGAVSMEDGTTSSVTTTSGEISHLLTVDTSSYKYYRAGGTADSGTGEKYDSSANNGLGVEWTDAPTATFEAGAVKWDLSSAGVLENGVTYTVTFDCWPSQTTLDIVADIKNDPSSYDSLDANIKKYIDENGNLKTNTTATLSYIDTRTGQSGSSTFENPDPVQTTAVEQLAISKEWENELDGQSAAPVTLTVTSDGKAHHTMTLSTDNDWTASTYISIGILRHSDTGEYTDSAGAKFEVLETGHDFTFTEPADLAYYWELDVPTIRPMLVDGTLTMLILKTDKYNNPDSTTEYTIDGKTYYTGQTGAASLTATNNRRARLNLTKVVDGEDADPTQTFPFTLNVVDSKAADGSADDLNSDYYVWFSVYNGGYVDAVVSGADKEFDEETGEWTGYYYAPSGSDIVVNLKAGDNLRFLNLPTASTYTFTEGTLPANYAFTRSKLTTGEDSTFKGAQSTTGTIESTNTDYTVTYTNTYALSDIEITKVWEDNDNQDGIRPKAEDFVKYLVLNADGTDVTSANAEKLTVTVDPEDSNKYIAKWTGLDRYADGEEITYTVEETEIEGYTTSGSPASDKGTITNTHMPETIDIPVSKKWDDENDRDKIRPESVTVNLIAGEGEDAAPVEGKTVTLSENNEWKDTFKNLPKYSDGVEIVYSVEEVKTDVITGTDGIGTYAIAVSGSVAAGFVVTNTHTFAVTTAQVKKVWDDADDQDGKRPENLTVTLLADEEVVTVTDDAGEETPVTATLSDANNWSTEKTDLPMYSEDGERIAYTWTEGDSAPEGYALTGNTTVDVTDEEGNITGVLTTLTNTHVPEVTKETVVKVWNDNDDQDGVRPDSLTVALLADGEAVTAIVADAETGEETEQPVTVTLNENNDWTDSVTDLPKYADGKIIKYTWDEKDLPEGYGLTKTETAEDKDEEETVIGTITTLTNTHNPEVTEATVEKIWNDNNDQDGIRPDSLTMTLLADGEPTGKTVTLSDDNEWTDTIEGLPVNDAGTPIVYSWTEPEITGYTPKEGDPTTTGTVTTFTNKHTPEVTQATIVKVWDDADDQDGKRPEGLTVSLKNGNETVASFTLDESNEWTATASNIPKYANGVEINYTWTEDALPDGYSLTKTETAEDKDEAGTVIGTITTLTNSHTPEITEATVKKVWDDNDDKAGKRPDSLTVTLSNGSETIKTETLSEANQWTATVTGLPKYANGVEINYTWAEGELPIGYVLTGNSKEGKVTTLTNTLKMGDLVIEKDLTRYNDFIIDGDDATIDQATFVFLITATWGEGEATTEIYRNYEALTFSGATSDKIELKEFLPVGAKVTVEEVYSGAGYKNTGDNKVMDLVIADPAQVETEEATVATANFANAYEDKIPGGYGIVNHYTKAGDSWKGQRVPAPTVELED